MRTKLHAITATLCLLTILISATSCMHLAMSMSTSMHGQASMDHQPAPGQCPMHGPPSKSIPSCCSTTHHPPSAITTADLQQPVFFSIMLTPLPADHIAPRFVPPPAQLAGPPPLPPRIALRI